MVVVDSSKIKEAGANFYWLTQDIIDRAVDPVAKNMLCINNELDTQFIKGVKKSSAEEVAP